MAQHHEPAVSAWTCSRISLRRTVKRDLIRCSSIGPINKSRFDRVNPVTLSNSHLNCTRLSDWSLTVPPVNSTGFSQDDKCITTYPKFMDRTFLATAGLQDLDLFFFKKAMKMVFKCILSVIFHLSGFKLQPCPIHVNCTRTCHNFFFF